MNQQENQITIRCCFPAGQFVPYECSDCHILVSWHTVVEGSSVELGYESGVEVPRFYLIFCTVIF